MRFIKAATPAGPRIGVLVSDATVALSARVGELADDLERLPELGAEIIAAPDTAEVAYSSLDLGRVVDPPSMRDFMIFEEHILPGYRSRGAHRAPDVWYEQPIGYFSNAASLRGPREPIEVPGGSQRLDFELEVGAIVSRSLRSVSPEEAGEAIAGFLVLCDWSARDLQFREMDGRLGPHKGKDFATSLGPILVTPDELEPLRRGNGYDVAMTSAVNGREYGRDHWTSAYWSFEDLISYASWNSVVDAGALIGSGTCQGGCILELSTRHSPEQFPWLTPGDHVSLTIDRLGEISAEVLPSARGRWPGVKTASSAG